MKAAGFTLIEIMITVSVISILAAVVVPKMNSARVKAIENVTKSNLKALRGSINMYTAAHEGKRPTTLYDLVSAGYLTKIPYAHVPGHGSFPGHSGDNTAGAGSMAGQGGNDAKWYYFNVYGESMYGQVVVNCNHMATDGVPWDQK